MVIPNGVVQAERRVASTPRGASGWLTLNDEIRHAEKRETRSEGKPRLAGADDDNVRLLRCLHRLLMPIPPIRHDPMLSTNCTIAAGPKRMAVQLLQGGEKRARAIIRVEAHMSLASSSGRLKAEPRLSSTRSILDCACRRWKAPAISGLRDFGGSSECLCNFVRTLKRPDVPRERHHVSPETGLDKQIFHLVGVSTTKG